MASVRYPSLDVFLPVCGEPLPVLHNTWVHVFELVRAYPGTSTAYVLDDGTDERSAGHGRGLRLQLDGARLTVAG